MNKYDHAGIERGCLAVLAQHGDMPIADVTREAGKLLGLEPTVATKQVIYQVLTTLARRKQIEKETSASDRRLIIVKAKQDTTQPVVKLDSIAETLQALSLACASVAQVAEHVRDTCEEALDLTWRQKIELLLADIIDRLARLEHRKTG